MSDSASTDVRQAVGNSCATSEDLGTDNSGTLQTRFGYRRWRPDCLQFLMSPRWFLLFMFLTVLFQSMIVNGLIGVTVSTIERRFALASSKAAWIAASYEIAGVPALLIIGYVGSALHRPVWMGAGLVMLGIGFGIYSIPHFVAPPYRYSRDYINLCVDRGSNISDENASLPPFDRCDTALFACLSENLCVSNLHLISDVKFREILLCLHENLVEIFTETFMKMS